MHSPRTEDIRRQLEGHLEVVEATPERYATLEGMLRGKRWRSRLRARLAALLEVIQHEPVLDEALASIRRRASRDNWPEETPALLLVRKVDACRARLSALVHQRLGLQSPAAWDATLPEKLSRLEQLVLEPPPPPLTREERLLLQGGLRVHEVFVLALMLYLGIHVLVIYVRLMGISPNAGIVSLGAIIVAIIVLGFLIYLRRNSGRYWLTQERLVWEPYADDPIQVPLRCIPSGGVHPSGWPEPSRVRVDVLGGAPIHLRYVQNAGLLVTLLELYRHPILSGVPLASDQVNALCANGHLSRKGSPAGKGCVVVVRPGRVVFLPKEDGKQMLVLLTGTGVPGNRIPIPLDVLFQQLRWLPVSDFDTYLERAVESLGGWRWTAGECEVGCEEGYDPGAESSRCYCFITRGQEVLKLDVDDLEALERLLTPARV